jgi:hypothetical protein
MIARRILITILLLALLAAISLFVTWDVAALQNQPDVSSALAWHVISASGGHAASASYEMEATLGQPIVDRSTGATTHLSAGFWQAESTGGYRIFLPLVLK